MMKQPLKYELILRLVLVAVSLFVGLVICEILLRTINISSYWPLWNPYTKIVSFSNHALPGINGRNEFSINSVGIRGDEFQKAFQFFLLAIGGSTTECRFLNDDEAWPKLTQEMIKEKGFVGWIGNEGKSGARIENHVKVLKARIKQFPFLDGVIALVGVNDMAVSLKNSVKNKTVLSSAWYKKTELWRLKNKIKRQFFAPKPYLMQNDDGVMYAKWRRNRQAAKKINIMPDISGDLSRYKASLNTFIDIAKQSNVRVIFMTQPTLWRDHLTAEEEELLWWGWAGGDQSDSTAYYSIDILIKAMARFNETLLEVCRERGAECIDLDKMLEKSTDVFYDDCHFNESGSRIIAQILSKYLLEDAPVKLVK